MIDNPQPGQWVLNERAVHVHGYVIGPIGERGDIFDVYMPYCTPPWRLTKLPAHCMGRPTQKERDDWFALYASYLLTGEP